MKIKTSELTGPALRYAVALALKDEGYRPYHNYEGADGWEVVWGEARFPDQRAWLRDWRIEEDWSQAGPIIDREGIMLRPIRCEGHSMHGLWLAAPPSSNTGQIVHWVEFIFKDTAKRGFWRGETALIAAMRCFIASHFGNEVDVPDELVLRSTEQS